jgi:uncharacterized membrane-anchored protein
MVSVRSFSGAPGNSGAMNSLSTSAPLDAKAIGRQMLNKVPEVTIFFWIIKILSTTVGETASDYLNETLGFGLHNTFFVMGALLVVAFVIQFRADRYVPWKYWVTVVLISIVGTLITDNLTDGWNVPLNISTAVFAVLLAITFAAWYRSERTLSIHSIYTRRREAYYWLTILFTFALGTAAGDNLQEQTGWSLGALALFWAAIIAVITALHYIFKARMEPEHRHRASTAVLAFWMAYIMTRPLGASMGDLLTTPKDESPAGLGFSTNGVSLVFAVIIIGLVTYLTISKRDVTEIVLEGHLDEYAEVPPHLPPHPHPPGHHDAPAEEPAGQNAP